MAKTPKKTGNKTARRKGSGQLRMLSSMRSDYGGNLQTKRSGRSYGRPLSTRHTMHLVLRSTKAKGERSFLRPQNKNAVRMIIEKFARKYSVKILSIANVGNHIHLHIKLVNRFLYFPFIRAVTGSIAKAIGQRRESDASAIHAHSVEKNAVGGIENAGSASQRRATGARTNRKFWDRRPFTRIVSTLADFENVVRYVRINRLESFGFSRLEARRLLNVENSSG